MTHRILSLLVIALAAFALAAAGCAALDQAFLRHQSEQLELARATYLAAAVDAGKKAKAAGVVDSDEVIRIAREAGEVAAAKHLKGRAYDKFLESLKERGPQVASDAVTGNMVGAGAGSLAILLQLVLALWQRGRNQQLAAAISASMSPVAAAILTGNPGAVVALTPAAAAAHIPPKAVPG